MGSPVAGGVVLSLLVVLLNPGAAGDIGTGPGDALKPDDAGLAFQLQSRLAADASSPVTLALDAARIAASHRLGLVGGPVASVLEAPLAQQARNLRLAAALAAMEDAPTRGTLTHALALTDAATAWHAASLGVTDVDPLPLARPASLTAALAALDARLGSPATIQPPALPDVSDATADALAGTIDAFLAFDTAARSAYTDGDPTNLDQALVLATRQHFLHSVMALRDALAPGQDRAECDEPMTGDGYWIDLSVCDNLYPDDLVLLIDGGGNDAYRNNAGGANIARGECEIISLQTGIFASAAVIDLGPGDDSYGAPDSERRCGVNGGGYLGAGFLFDEGGNDAYMAGADGVNGGATLGGSGFLLDGGGQDTYRGYRDGVNGGAEQGVAMLIDIGSADEDYRAQSLLGHEGSGGINGGGNGGGVGFLYDGGGNDTYFARSDGANGGGSLGTGFLFDADGDDTYSGHIHGVNGGGGNLGGVGFLVDLDGDDTYSAQGTGVNGGAWSYSTGMLIDVAGQDHYEGRGTGVNGGAADSSLGFLIDGQGNDHYEAAGGGTNGGGADVTGDILSDEDARAMGSLFDAAGDDTYTATWRGVNGGGWNGNGFLLDAGGNDQYRAETDGANGGGYALGDDDGRRGHLIDLGGLDLYEDLAIPGGSCWDCTIYPKGRGMQADSDDPPA